MVGTGGKGACRVNKILLSNLFPVIWMTWVMVNAVGRKTHWYLYLWRTFHSSLGIAISMYEQKSYAIQTRINCCCPDLNRFLLFRHSFFAPCATRAICWRRKLQAVQAEMLAQQHPGNQIIMERQLCATTWYQVSWSIPCCWGSLLHYLHHLAINAQSLCCSPVACLPALDSKCLSNERETARVQSCKSTF